jgi:hypothetical protein
MSIYATLWSLKFPKRGDDYPGCEWIKVTAQGVPPHIGSSNAGYEDGDPYESFLPPPVETDEDGDGRYMRAVVFVKEGIKKGTPENGQEYIDPLLVVTGEEYARMTIEELYQRICDALRGDQPRIAGQFIDSTGKITIMFEDGSKEYLDLD